MIIEAPKEITFSWNPEFEVGLAKLLLNYRIMNRPEGSVESSLNFERRTARDFARGLLTLMESLGPELADDSDIARRIASMRGAHDGALGREIARHGGVR